MCVCVCVCVCIIHTTQNESFLYTGNGLDMVCMHVYVRMYTRMHVKETTNIVMIFVASKKSNLIRNIS